jgi:hypothetical protein
VRLEGKPNPKDSVPQLSLSPWPSSASGTHSWRSTDRTGWMVVPVIVSTVPSAPSTSTLATTWTSRVTNRAVTTEPSPPAIGGQSSMAVTNASPETSSSGRFSGNNWPAQRPLSNIHERGRMISASIVDQSTAFVDFDAVSISSCHLAILEYPGTVPRSNTQGQSLSMYAFLVCMRSLRVSFPGTVPAESRGTVPGYVCVFCYGFAC